MLDKGMANELKMYLEENFKRISEKMDSDRELMNHKLQEIHQQTLKTNGRVTENEREIRMLRENQIKCPIGGVSKRIDDVDKLLSKYEKETESLRFFAKNPKLIKATLIGLILMNVTTIVAVLTMISKMLSENF